jgi:hypothetical protein
LRHAQLNFCLPVLQNPWTNDIIRQHDGDDDDKVFFSRLVLILYRPPCAEETGTA